MRRRDFIAGLGSAAIWPVVVRAQQPAMPVIGYLHISFPEPYANQVGAFRKGLSEAGFVEGSNVAFEFRWAQNEFDRLPELAADLVRRRVTVIATPGGPAAALAAKAATTTIPIVFSSSIDPVQLGLVPSLSRPGGNITGFTDLHVDLSAKRLGLLQELIPGAARFAVLVNPSYPATEAIVADLQAAAAAIGRQIEVITASTNREIDAAFASLSQRGAEALLVNPDSLFTSRRVQLVTLAVRYGIPAIYSQREHVDAGGLMSYGTNPMDRNRQVGIYVGRILKGEKPADLPVQRPAKFEFVINLKTAKALGLTIPETLLATADEVIQ